MTEATCKTCKFFVAHTEHPGAGNCQRRAPVVVAEYYQDPLSTSGAMRTDVYTSWPVVAWPEWCGEWSQKEEQKLNDD